jgi:hypothetical protein
VPVRGGEVQASASALLGEGRWGIRWALEYQWGRTPSRLASSRLQLTGQALLAVGPLRLGAGGGIYYASFEKVTSTETIGELMVTPQASLGVALGRLGPVEPFLEVQATWRTVSALVGLRLDVKGPGPPRRSPEAASAGVRP